MNNFRIGTRLSFGFLFLLVSSAALAGTGIWLVETLMQSGAHRAQFATFRLYFVGAALASLLIGIVLSIRIVRSVTGRLNRAMASAQTIATRDTAANITLQGDDELDRLLQALKHITNSQRRIVGGIRHSAYHITTASDQILTGTQNLAHRTEEQASSLTQTASAIEQLTATVRQNADNAQQANTLAMAATQVATRGGDIVSEVIATMDSINDSSKKVEDIIGVIDSIAFQTNILALNAAVESARAGEAGRGFAVVASEVRSLAQRSAQAAHEIKELITSSVASAAAGNQLVGEAGATMTEIVESIQRVTDIMGEITAASQEQTTGIEQVNDAVIQMDQMTRQNTALVDETTSAAKTLQEQADYLVNMLTAFKTDEKNTSGTRKTLSITPPDTTKPDTGTLRPTSAGNRPNRRHTTSSLPSSQALLASNQKSATTSGKKKAPSAQASPSGVTVGSFQTSAGAVEEWEEF